MDDQDTSGRHGAGAEERVHALNVRAAFEDFSFQNPTRTDRTTELADHLIWFDDVVVFFQVKARGKSGDSAARAERWLRKNARKAIRQAGGTLRTLRSGRITALRNARRGTVPFDPATVSAYHAVVILAHSDIPLLSQQELGGTGQPPDSPVHVLSLRDWDFITFEHDTTPDLVRWLDERAALLRSVRFYIDREKDALVCGLAKGAPLEAGDFPSRDVPLGTAEQFAAQHRDALIARDQANEVSKLVDEVINVAHTGTADLFPTPDWLKGANLITGAGTYVDIAVELGRTQRLNRRMLGDWMYKKAVLSGEDGKEHFFAAPLPSGTWLVFVVSSQPRGERVHRATLIAYGFKQQQKVDRILGVATEPVQSQTRTYDLWLLDVPYQPDPHFEEQFGRVFQDGQEVTVYELPAG